MSAFILRASQGLDAQMALNGAAQLAIAAAMLPALQRSTRGALLCFVSSFMGATNQLDQWPAGSEEDAYVRSKNWLNRRFRALEPTWRMSGVTAVAVHPGYVQTRMTGGTGDLTAAESARAVRELLEAPSTRPARAGLFLQYTGHTLSWVTGAPLEVGVDPASDAARADAYLKLARNRTQVAEACEPFCVEACSELNGNVTAECGGCSDGFTCRPGALGYDKDSADDRASPHSPRCSQPPCVHSHPGVHSRPGGWPDVYVERLDSWRKAAAWDPDMLSETCVPRTCL